MEVPGFPGKKVGLSQSPSLSIRTRVLRRAAEFDNPTRERGLQFAYAGLQSAPRLRVGLRLVVFSLLRGDSNANPKQIAGPSQQSNRYYQEQIFLEASLHRRKAQISVEMLHQKRIGCRNLRGDRICFFAFLSLVSNCRQFRRSPPY